jgi:ethanolamine utilization protein EutP (predicted NTPase)
VKSREKTAKGVQLNIRNNENEKRYNISCPVELFRHFHPYHAINVQAIDLHMEMCLLNRHNTFVIFICIVCSGKPIS